MDNNHYSHSKNYLRKMIQNLFRVTGYNAFAIPLAAGVHKLRQYFIRL